MSVLLILPVVLLAVAGCESSKSANPLSPAVAGPIPGVNITPPMAVEPKAAKVAVDKQPITLVVENAASNGQRPLSYVFEVATDAAFTNTVWSRTGVAPGDGRTTMRLPDALATERSYYWRARAEDGANTGPFSAPANFDVFTPIVIQAPELGSPAHNSLVTSLRPFFSFSNAVRSGPVGPITYSIELSTTSTFATGFDWTAAEQAGIGTLTQMPIEGQFGQYLFWRVRAADPTTVGPWSETRAFSMPEPPPAPVVPDPGPFTGPVGDWQSCPPTAGEALVQCVHRAINPARTEAGAFEVVKRVAWLLRGQGAGLLIKNGGENIVPWKGYSFSASRICYPDGHIYKLLSDVPTTNGPSWQDNDFVDRSLYLPAIDPR
ncbi:MAG: hypothetical protein ABI868_21295 [Acidobacteriota bacterium]